MVHLICRAVANHPEAYVRRAALFAASRVIVALHPSQVVMAITSTDSNITSGLEWVREWALGIANNDPDSDCATVSFLYVNFSLDFCALNSLRAQVG
jgi:telomere length regulation protein